MTKRSHPDSEFTQFAGYKFELDRELLKNFGDVCRHLEVKKTDVLRNLMAEFVEEIRNQIMAEGKPVD